MTARCAWVNEDPLYIDYHDREWGVPVRDDRKWFELLVLEGAQAGLSWYTVLKKREGYRQAFDGSIPAKWPNTASRNCGVDGEPSDHPQPPEDPLRDQ